MYKTLLFIKENVFILTPYRHIIKKKNENINLFTDWKRILRNKITPYNIICPVLYKNVVYTENSS